MSEIKPVVSIFNGKPFRLANNGELFQPAEGIRYSFEAHALSAHRTPNEVIKLAEGAKDRGIKIVYCGCRRSCSFGWSYRIQHNTAGNRRSDSNKCTGGMDSLLSTVQMLEDTGRNSCNRKSRCKRMPLFWQHRCLR